MEWKSARKGNLHVSFTTQTVNLGGAFPTHDILQSNMSKVLLSLPFFGLSFLITLLYRVVNVR